MKRTTTEAELRQWVAEGKTAKEIGEILGLSCNTIADAKSVLGIYGGGRIRKLLKPVDFDFVMAQFEKGNTVKQIEKALALPVNSLAGRLKTAGLPTSKAKYWEREAKKARS